MLSLTSYRGFPDCKDGDVLIILHQEKKLRLHSENLIRHSVFFRDEFRSKSHPYQGQPYRKSSSEVAVKWRVDLHVRFKTNINDTLEFEGPGQLKIHALNHQGIPYDGAPLPENVQVTNHEVYGAYEQVFGAMYSRPIIIAHNDMVHILSRIEETVQIGEFLGCMHLISPFISGMLLEHGQNLFQAIAKMPFSWGELGLRIRSSSIVREAIIHLTGRWRTLPDGVRNQLPASLRKIVELKDKELTEKKKGMELTLMNYHPSHMEHRQSNTDLKKLSRIAYSNDIMSWIILATFRQYLGGCLADGQGRDSADGGWILYSKFYKGSQEYLSNEDLQTFHTVFAMTVRGEKALEREIDTFKEDITNIIEPLFANFSNIDTSKWKLGYFTCVQITDEDIKMLWNEGFDALNWSDDPAQILENHSSPNYDFQHDDSNPVSARTLPSSTEQMIAPSNQANAISQHHKSKGTGPTRMESMASGTSISPLPNVSFPPVRDEYADSLGIVMASRNDSSIYEELVSSTKSKTSNTVSSRCTVNSGASETTSKSDNGPVSKKAKTNNGKAAKNKKAAKQSGLGVSSNEVNHGMKKGALEE